MAFEARQAQFENITHLDADPHTRRLLLMDTRWQVHLVAWSTGASLRLPRFEIPRERHHLTQGQTFYTGGPSIFDIRLSKAHASILTSEGLWTCELREDARWVRITGHPNDPPEGMTLGNARSLGFKGPIALAPDGNTLRRGSSHPVVLSADGATVVGAPSLHDILGCAVDYTLELKALTIEAPEPTPLPVKLRSGIEALAVSADGSAVAFSEGRDFRIHRSGQKRASQFLHNKMYIRTLALSGDGRFAAATGLYPDDLMRGPTRTILWDVDTREILDIITMSRIVGFTGRGEHMRLALTRIESASWEMWTTRHVELYVPGVRNPAASYPCESAQAVRGDASFLVMRGRDNQAQVIATPEGASVEPAAPSPQEGATLAHNIKQAPGSTFNLFLYSLASLQHVAPGSRQAGSEVWEASDCLINYAVLGDIAAASTGFEALLPTLRNVLAAYNPAHSPHWRTILGCLALDQLARAGVALNANLAIDNLRADLRRLKPDTHRDALRLAWAALALGDHAWAAQILPFDPATAHRSGSFGTNEQRIFSHLFRAVTGTGEADAPGAWRAWLRAFPQKVTQEWSSWPELLWAAHVMHCQIEGAPEASLIAWLYDEARVAL